ncbi:hypothetical protein [Enterocloster citroniae]|uniref:hypothetical protein n=1 Tax=Enterocloster citroniae TaxID=358743 RepID=UPI0030497B9D|nr:hypothetical protein [Enterocloster citroniae]
MKLKDLWVRIGNIEVSSKDMIKLSLECGKAVIEYDEPDTPEGVSKFSRLICRPSEVEFICPYEASEKHRDITGSVTKTTFCTKECPYDT